MLGYEDLNPEQLQVVERLHNLGTNYYVTLQIAIKLVTRPSRFALVGVATPDYSGI